MRPPVVQSKDRADDGAVTHPACGDCKHYHVTWDRTAPHGCSAFGFKTARRPSRVVYESSGSVCELFCARKDV